MAREPSLSIGEVAARAGLRTSAIRYYEAAGLLPAADRVSGRRRYDADVVELLSLIRFCQRVGFSLDEVRALLASPHGRAAKERWRQLVDGKLAEVQALIEQAEAVRALLEESRDCDCVALEGCRLLRDELDSRGVRSGPLNAPLGAAPLAGKRPAAATR